MGWADRRATERGPDGARQSAKGTVRPTVAPQQRDSRPTAALLSGGLAAVLPLGDNQYSCGGLAAFNASYDLSWGP